MRLRHELGEMHPHRVDGVHAVVDKEDLSAALQFAQDRHSGELRRIRADVRDDRQTLFRRRVQVGDVADAGQRHVERARNWRGGESQHIHFGPEFLEMLLVGHAKALFLVDDDQPEVLELTSEESSR